MNQDFRQKKDYQEYAEERTISRRISILTWGTGLILLGYFLAFWYLQVIEGAQYARQAEENRTRRIEVPAARGAILDRSGEPIVLNRISFSVVIDREKVKDWPGTFATLARALEQTPDGVAEEFRRSAARRYLFEPVVLAEDVHLGTVAFVEARRAELPGVTIGIEDRRYYQTGASGAHLVGYVGEVSQADLDSGRLAEARRGDFVGKAGLEKYFDAELRGRDGYRQVIVNSVGREIGELAGGVAPQAGANVRSSVDLDMQRALDLAFGDKVGAAVFLNPRTGEVLALTSKPGYDPNLFVKRLNRSIWRTLVADPRHPLQNRALQSSYSPGSTFKTIMTAAALETGAITPGTVFHCGGVAYFYGRPFLCHEKRGHGAVDLHRAIAKSCNIYFYNVGKRLGIETIAAYARRFGLGRTTGLGVAFEEAGLVPDEEWKKRVIGDRWYPSETISVSIGQGPLLVTPLQQAVVAAALATDGRLVTPTLRILADAEQAGGPASRREPRGEPLSPATIDVIQRAMWAVVNEGGTAARARIKGFDVCGKTGTAQVVLASAGVKNETELAPEQRDHSWFIGFAPRWHPEVAFAIFVEHGGHGSESAAPIAKQVLDAYLKKRKGPDPVPPPAEVAVGPSSAATRVF